MPRPLIIKVEDHKLQSNKKATGSINIQLMQGPNKSFYEKYSFETDNASLVTAFSSTNREPSNPPDEHRSIVRNLISRYESSTNANLTKYKSKSMVDLQKPLMEPMAPRASQDDLLYNRHKYHSNDPTEGQNQKFDFKTVFLKFETTNRSGQQVNRSTQKITNYASDQLDLNDLKAKARVLLETRQGNFAWQDQVVEFLHQIENWDGDHHQDMTESRPSRIEKSSGTNERTKLQRAKSLDPAEFNKVKVRDIKNIFDARVADNDQGKSPTRSVSSYAAYFGIKNDEPNVRLQRKASDHGGARSNVPNNFDDYDYELESGDSEDSDLHQEGSYDLQEAMNDAEVEGNRVITQPVMASSARIRDLKNYFESDSDKYAPFDEFSQNQADFSDGSESENIHVVDNRMLPPPKVVVLDQESTFTGLEDSKHAIEELTKDIEDFEVRIAELTVDNKDEGRYVNEVLVRILLKLDDVKTYGDEVVLRERRKAIEFVQSCIVKLKARLHGSK